MKLTIRFVGCILASVLIFCGNASGGCGGKGGKGGKGSGGSHGGVGVGGSVDLGGVGQRKSEADPFAVGGKPASSQSQERHKPRTKEPVVTKSNPFSGIKLTGKQAKDVAAADNSAASPNE